MLNDFFSKNDKERELLILKIIKNQISRVNLIWYPLIHLENGNEVKINVMADALMIDNIRIAMSAHTSQLIADKLNCSLLTAKMCDLIWNYSDIKLKPQDFSINKLTKTMIDNSLSIDKEINKRNGLIGLYNRNWIIDNDLDLSILIKPAVSYGWHISGSSYGGIKGNKPVSGYNNFSVLHPINISQNSDHFDSSYYCRLMSNNIMVNNVKMTTDYVLKHKELSKLISHTGIINKIRVPSVQTSNFFTESFIDEIKRK
jgi:hypothetical protein